MLEEIRNAIIITVHLDTATRAFIYSRCKCRGAGRHRFTHKDAGPNYTFRSVRVNISQLNCPQFKYCCPSPDETIKWHLLLHFDSSYTLIKLSAAVLTNTNSDSLLKFQVGVFFFFFSSCLLSEQGHPEGVQETNSSFHFMHRER